MSGETTLTREAPVFSGFFGYGERVRVIVIQEGRKNLDNIRNRLSLKYNIEIGPVKFSK